MKHSSDTTQSRGDRERALAYHRDFWPAIIGYVIAVGLVVAFVDPDSSSPWNYLWVLLPLAPALLIVRAVVRHLGRIDEFQRMVQFEAMATGFGAAMAASVTLGFLGTAGLAPRASGWFVFSSGMIAWGVSAALISKRSG